jgi:hypothetical protein
MFRLADIIGGGKSLMITTYQIRNVLRVYGNQLKKKSLHWQGGHDMTHKPDDLVDISIDARRKQKLNEMSNDLISQMTPSSGEKQVSISAHPDNDAGGLRTINNGK